MFWKKKEIDVSEKIRIEQIKKSKLIRRMKDISQEKLELTEQLYKLDTEIDELIRMRDDKNYVENIRISDHAFARYFERVKGYDMEKIKKEILDETTINFINDSEVNLVHNKKGYQLRVKGKVVTTLVFDN